MELKIPKKNLRSGFTLVELIVVVTLMVLFFAGVMLIVNPAEKIKRGRDETRLSDVSSLDRAISEYKIDNEAYPGLENTQLVSTTVASGGVGPVQNASSGWIGENLSGYIPRLPTDPLNNATYHYSYMHLGSAYEITAVLEYEQTFMQNDGGSDPNKYEIGNSLNVIP